MEAIRKRFLLGAALLAVGVPSLAQAFIPFTYNGNTGIVQPHWLDSQLPVRTIIRGDNFDIPSATAFAILRDACETWEAIPTSYLEVDPIEYTGAPGEQFPQLAYDLQNSVFFDNGFVFFPPNVIAFERFFYDLNDGHFLESDVVFNDVAWYWSTTDPLTPAPPGQLEIDLQSVAVHEFGHHFGLDHTSVEGATMLPFIPGDITFRSLELDDQAGVSHLWPESAARGLSPGAIDFAATTGILSGTVVFNGGAPVFGAHVEAINTASPTPDHTISAISGELTARNGQGEFRIHGLPPGTYNVRIVPLDGAQTTVSDGNIGGIFNGIDTNFESEYWNGANESGNGFSDLASDRSPVTVSMNTETSGINFITNMYPGRVSIAQYGTAELFVTSRVTGFRAMRFDPPFATPYTITDVRFSSFTFDGLPAGFPSVQICPMNPATGLPDLSAPIFSQAPFNGNPNGENIVPVNYVVTTANQTFFLLLEFPFRVPPDIPPAYPFVFMDFQNLERGLFANSYSISATGVPDVGSNVVAPGVLIDRNLIMSMTCDLGSSDLVPITAPSSLGGNLVANKGEFTYRKPAAMRADGTSMPANSLTQMHLLRRAPFAYAVEGTAGSEADKINKSSIPSGPQIWTVQAVDRFGHSSLQSNVTITGRAADPNEGNGSVNTATAIGLPVFNYFGSIANAGDQDFYSFNLSPGQFVDLSATSLSADGRDDLDLMMVLYDQNGEIAAFSDDFSGLNPRIFYSVPRASTSSSGNGPRKFTLRVADIYGSEFFTGVAPREINPLGIYNMNLQIFGTAQARGLAGGLSEDRFAFVRSGENPANPHAKFTIVIPRSGGSLPVKLRIYDARGRLVRSVMDGPVDPGIHAAIWDGRDETGQTAASGQYFARLEAGPHREQLRVTLVK